MESIKDRIVIIIGTVGYPTFNKCLEHAERIKKIDDNVEKIIIVKDKYPISAWLNEMIKLSQGFNWCLQLDEDMYAYENAAKELLLLAKREQKNGIKINNASAMLNDIFLKHKIGSIKLWNVDSLQMGTFKDVLGSDRQFAKDAEKNGFYNASTSVVLGEHDSAPSVEIAYFKYKEYISKIKHFQGIEEARKSIKYFRNIYKIENTKIAYAAYIGAVAGIKANYMPKTKNYLDNVNSDEIEILYRNLKKSNCNFLGKRR